MNDLVHSASLRPTEDAVVAGHTPGPWEISRSHDMSGYPVFYINGLSGDDKYDAGAMKANARLIAAAPELSAELIEARSTLSIVRTQIMVEIGRCADPGESRWDGVPERLKERLDAIDAAISKATGGSQ